MRAFIFSLDAFVAFTLALVAIYSLIFFSSVPSAYYFLLTQGHYLSRDALLSLSTTTCGDMFGYTSGTCQYPANTVIDNIVTMNDPTNLIQSSVGGMIPPQFGYVMELSSDKGNTWTVLYDTASNPSDNHANMSKKLAVATQVMTFGYSSSVNKLTQSPYEYCTCGPQAQDCSGSGGGAGSSGNGKDLGIITCGVFTTNSTNGGVTTNTTTIMGNTPPDQILGQLVPGASVKILKLTVYI